MRTRSCDIKKQLPSNYHAGHTSSEPLLLDRQIANFSQEHSFQPFLPYFAFKGSRKQAQARVKRKKDEMIFFIQQSTIWNKTKRKDPRPRSAEACFPSCVPLLYTTFSSALVQHLLVYPRPSATGHPAVHKTQAWLSKIWVGAVRGTIRATEAKHLRRSTWGEAPEGWPVSLSTCRLIHTPFITFPLQLEANGLQQRAARASLTLSLGILGFWQCQIRKFLRSRPLSLACGLCQSMDCTTLTKTLTGKILVYSTLLPSLIPAE